MSNIASVDTERAHIRAGIDVDLCRKSLKAVICALAHLWVTYPVLAGDNARPVWKVVEKCLSPAWVLVPLWLATVLLISAIWVPRARLFAACVFGGVLGGIACWPWQAYYSCSLIGLALLCVPLGALGARVPDYKEIPVG